MFKKLVLALFLSYVQVSFSASYALNTFVMSEAYLQKVIFELDQASEEKEVKKVVKIYNEIGHNAFMIIASSLYWNCGNSFLHKAAYDDAGEIVYLLLWLGIDPNILNAWHETPLLCSIHWGNAAIVKLFLQNSVNLAIENGQGKTAMEVALQHGHEALAFLLYKHGAIIRKKEKV